MNVVKIIWISNIIWEPYLLPSLKETFSASDMEVDLLYIPYEEYGDRVSDFHEAAYIVVSLNFDYMYPDAINDLVSGTVSEDTIVSDTSEKCNVLYNTIKNVSAASVIWIGFEDYCYRLGAVLGPIWVAGGAGRESKSFGKSNAPY